MARQTLKLQPDDRDPRIVHISSNRKYYLKLGHRVSGQFSDRVCMPQLMEEHFGVDWSCLVLVLLTPTENQVTQSGEILQSKCKVSLQWT